MHSSYNHPTSTTRGSMREFSIKFAAITTCVFLSISLSLGAFGQYAHAKQSDNDIVGGYTAAQRGLTASNLPSITAKAAYVQDSDGNVYFERNADVESQIASVTKVMTCILALESADLSKEIHVSERAASIGESSAYLVKGDVVDLKNALIGLMIPSGNDAACAIAENIGADFVATAKSEGSQILDVDGNPIDLDGKNAGYNAFVAKMNEKAKEIGMHNTVFTNPHGLDINQFRGEKLHSTARDVSTMSIYGMQIPEFREIVDNGDTDIIINRDGKKLKVKLEGTDKLIGSYEGACGIKTGFTEEAGGCFTGAVLRDGKYLYAVVLGSSSNDQKFDDAKTIYEWVYDSNKEVPLVSTEQYLESESDGSDIPVLAEIPQTDWIDKTVKATVKEPDKKVSVNSIFGNVTQTITEKEISGDIKTGDVVGAIEYYQGDNLLASEDLIACEDAEAPGFLDSAFIAVQRFLGFFGGSDSHAEMKIYNKTEPILSKA